MKWLSDENYEDVAQRLLDKGLKPGKKLFARLEKADFTIRVEGKIFKVYASKLFAHMHELLEGSNVKALDI